MKPIAAWVSGTTVDGSGASVLFFGFQWIFTIFEPSGKGFPLPGMPARIRQRIEHVCFVP
jgi:hypothetical protein